MFPFINLFKLPVTTTFPHWAKNIKFSYIQQTINRGQQIHFLKFSAGGRNVQEGLSYVVETERNEIKHEPRVLTLAIGVSKYMRDQR